MIAACVYDCGCQALRHPACRGQFLFLMRSPGLCVGSCSRVVEAKRHQMEMTYRLVVYTNQHALYPK